MKEFCSKFYTKIEIQACRRPFPAASPLFPGSTLNPFSDLFLPLCSPNSDALFKSVTTYEISTSYSDQR